MDVPYFYGLERQALERHGARYNCRWCSAAYTLVCCNPICPSTGKRPVREPGVHTLPVELVEGVKHERRARRNIVNQAIEADRDRLYHLVAAHVRAFRAAYPSRKRVRVDLPRVHEATTYVYSYQYRDRSPFHDERLPAPLYIAWETVCVDLRDGTYAPSRSGSEIPRPELPA